jgi:hypothetical protein
MEFTEVFFDKSLAFLGTRYGLKPFLAHQPVGAPEMKFTEVILTKSSLFRNKIRLN